MLCKLDQNIGISKLFTGFVIDLLFPILEPIVKLIFLIILKPGLTVIVILCDHFVSRVSVDRCKLIIELVHPLIKTGTMFFTEAFRFDPFIDAVGICISVMRCIPVITSESTGFPVQIHGFQICQSAVNIGLSIDGCTPAEEDRVILQRFSVIIMASGTHGAEFLDPLILRDDRIQTCNSALHQHFIDDVSPCDSDLRDGRKHIADLDGDRPHILIGFVDP